MRQTYPQSARQATGIDSSSARRVKALTRKGGMTVTPDQILDLKRRLNALTQEKLVLKAKVARFANLQRSLEVQKSQNFLEAQEREIHGLEAMIQGHRTQLSLLQNSDRVYQSVELQEEAKMLYLERQRIKKAKSHMEDELKKTIQLEQEAIKKGYPEIIAKQNKTIQDLEREIFAIQDANQRLKEMLESEESARDTSSKETHEEQRNEES